MSSGLISPDLREWSSPHGRAIMLFGDLAAGRYMCEEVWQNKFHQHGFRGLQRVEGKL